MDTTWFSTRAFFEVGIADKPKVSSPESDNIEPAPPIEAISHDHANGLDTKHIGEISMVRGQEATQ